METDNVTEDKMNGTELSNLPQFKGDRGRLGKPNGRTERRRKREKMTPDQRRAHRREMRRQRGIKSKNAPPPAPVAAPKKGKR